LSAAGIKNYHIFLGKYGTDMETARPTILLEIGPDVNLSNIPTFVDVEITILKIKTHEPGADDVLLKGYNPRPGPGSIIGANASPGSFAAGWWVRDVDSGSVFNLTTAHALRVLPHPKHTWSHYLETLESETVDCPPLPVINSTVLHLRQDINQFRMSGDNTKMYEAISQLAEVESCKDRRDWGTVVAAGYGEYEYEGADGELQVRLEDLALIRVRSSRIGVNSIPSKGSLAARSRATTRNLVQSKLGKSAC
jgi:hypothetical protein